MRGGASYRRFLGLGGANSSARANGVAEPTDGQAPDQDRPADARRLDTGTNPLLMGNGKGVALGFLGGTCGP